MPTKARKCSVLRSQRRCSLRHPVSQETVLSFEARFDTAPGAVQTAGDEAIEQTCPAGTLCPDRALHEAPKARTHRVGLLQPGLVPSALDPRQRQIEPERE